MFMTKNFRTFAHFIIFSVDKKKFVCYINRMNKIKLEQIESLLRCKTSEKKLGKLKFAEIVDVIRATTTFIKVINIIFKHDENITIAD